MAGQGSQLTALGMTVTVTETALDGEALGREITAQVGQTVVKLRHTFGADDGPRVALSVEDLQAQIDAARQAAANEAAWREDLRVKLEQLK